MDLQKFRQQLRNGSFESATTLLRDVKHSLFPTSTPGAFSAAPRYADCDPLRAILVFAHYGAIQCYTKCPGCHKGARLRQEYRADSESWRFQWACATWKGHSCWSEAIGAGGVLDKLRVRHYFPFLHFIVLMKSDYRMKNIYQEMLQGYGVHHPAVDEWKRTYQSALKAYVEEVDGAQIGGLREVVVVDETTMSRDVVATSKTKGLTPQGRGRLSRKNPLLLRALPARTIWKRVQKKPSASTVQKKPSTRYYKAIAGGSQDKRANSRWLWVGTEAGSSSEKKSHKEGNKRVALRLLPRQEAADGGKPRGAASLGQAMATSIRPGSQVVSDEWRATQKAAEAQGLRFRGAVRHSKGFRDPVSGIHSNDAESEVARLKLFLRAKYGFVRASSGRDSAQKDAILDGNIAEYVFYTNVGRGIEHVMRAFRHVGGVTGKPGNL